MRPPLSLLLALTGACASAGKGTSAAQVPAPAAPATAPSAAKSESTSVERLQYPSTYARHPNPPVLIRNATIMTATGQEIPNGSIVLKDGRIVAGGVDLRAHGHDPPILEHDRAVRDLLAGRGHDRGVADQDRRVGMSRVSGRVLWSLDAGALRLGGRGRGRWRLRGARRLAGRRARAREYEQQRQRWPHAAIPPGLWST